MRSSRSAFLKIAAVTVCSAFLSNTSFAKGGDSGGSTSPSTPSSPSVPAAAVSPGGIVTQLSSGFSVTLRSYTANGAGSPTRTTNDPFFSNMVSMALMSQQSTAGSGNFSASEAYAKCKATYANGQLKVTSGPTVRIVVQTFARQFTAYGSASCIPGNYIGHLSSNQLGTSEVSYANGPKTIGGTVCLTENALANTVIQLVSYQPIVATVTPSVTIPAGQRCGNYVVTVKGFADTFIHAKLNGYWLSSLFRVNP